MSIQIRFYLWLIKFIINVCVHTTIIYLWLLKKKKKKTHTQYFCVKGTLDFYLMVSPKANRGELIKKIFVYIWKGTLIYFSFLGFLKSK